MIDGSVFAELGVKHFKDLKLIKYEKKFVLRLLSPFFIRQQSIILIWDIVGVFISSV